jgi:hypothetical protein
MAGALQGRIWAIREIKEGLKAIEGHECGGPGRLVEVLDSLEARMDFNHLPKGRGGYTEEDWRPLASRPSTLTLSLR